MSSVSTFPGPVFVPIGRAAPGGVVRVRAMCSLDAYSEAAARSELLSLCGPEGSARSILLHLGPQVFVGLRGLDVLLQAAAWARKGGRALLIIEPPECLTRLLDLLGMNDRLCLVSSTGQAARVLGINKPHGWVDERHGD